MCYGQGNRRYHRPTKLYLLPEELEIPVTICETALATATGCSVDGELSSQWTPEQTAGRNFHGLEWALGPLSPR